MFEKVNPSHPDKIADRIAGAIVDLAYTMESNPKVAVEVLIGHGKCTVMAESSVPLIHEDIDKIVKRISLGSLPLVNLYCVPQDPHLAENQEVEFRCGDNGIFKGAPVTSEQKRLTAFARKFYSLHPTDGKYILDDDSMKMIICQSNYDGDNFDYAPIYEYVVNPLGYWTGGLNVDSGATNRKLGSDMGDGVTGGGLHGKDLSKADVSVNIWCHILAQQTGREYKACCAIGDTTINGTPYREIVAIARQYIEKVGGFEKFAEWGLI